MVSRVYCIKYKHQHHNIAVHAPWAFPKIASPPPYLGSNLLAVGFGHPPILHNPKVAWTDSTRQFQGLDILLIFLNLYFQLGHPEYGWSIVGQLIFTNTLPQIPWWWQDMEKLFTLMLHITGPLWGESTSDWWIPLIKGQLCGALLILLLSAWASC